MNVTIENTRGPFHGVGQIVRFNWPQYVAAAITVTGILLALNLKHAPAWMWTGGLVLIFGAVWWSLASLAASWWVYDCSSLMTWRWITGEFRTPVKRWLNVHAGLDESTARLREFWPAAVGKTVDIFNPAEMTEGSIHRARHEEQNPSIRVDYRKLPFAAGEFDAVFLFFAAHELRTARARDDFFKEVSRILETNGRAVLVEHLRDAANFTVYGPGYLHFHSRTTWLANLEAAGLKVEREFPFTAFVRVFVLRKDL